MTTWGDLSKEQQEAVQAFRDNIHTLLLSETALFNERWPELQLSWNFTADSIPREVVAK